MPTAPFTPELSSTNFQNFPEGLCFPETAVEREVKFATTRDLLLRGGVELEKLPKTSIEQRYFAPQYFSEVAALYEARTGAKIPDEIKDEISQARIRKSVFRDEVTYELTMKTPRNSLGLGERIELPAARLSAEEFATLVCFASAGMLLKDRYEVPTPPRFGVDIAIDVVRKAGSGDAEQAFGRAGWQIVTIDVEAESAAALRRLIRDPGVVEPFLAAALMLEYHPRLRKSLGATNLALGDRHSGMKREGKSHQRGRFEKCERDVLRLLRRGFVGE